MHHCWRHPPRQPQLSSISPHTRAHRLPPAQWKRWRTCLKWFLVLRRGAVAPRRPARTCVQRRQTPRQCIMPLLLVHRQSMLLVHMFMTAAQLQHRHTAAQQLQPVQYQQQQQAVMIPTRTWECIAPVGLQAVPYVQDLPTDVSSCQSWGWMLSPPQPKDVVSTMTPNGRPRPS